MKTLGILLIILSLFIGYISDSITNEIWFERAIGFSFGIFLYGIFILIKTSNCRFMRGVPNPPEHLRPKKKCICNDIGKHTPGGRCEADHSDKDDKLLNLLIEELEKNSVPFPKNRPKLILSPKNKKKYLEYLEKPIRPEFPKDRN